MGREGHFICEFWLCCLWKSNVCAPWGNIVARLILASGYDASRGGSAGQGFKILEMTRERDELGNHVANPADPETGMQINVTRPQPLEAGYPTILWQNVRCS